MAILEGLCEWAAVKNPNTTFTPEYQITMILDDKTADDFSNRGFRVKDADGVKRLCSKEKLNVRMVLLMQYLNYWTLIKIH